LRNIERFSAKYQHLTTVRALNIIKKEEKRPLGNPRSRWMYNLKMDLGEIGWGVMDWIGPVQDKCEALMKAVMNFPVP
jgi:hypothetical protein